MERLFYYSYLAETAKMAADKAMQNRDIAVFIRSFFISTTPLSGYIHKIFTYGMHKPAY